MKGKAFTKHSLHEKTAASVAFTYYFRFYKHYPRNLKIPLKNGDFSHEIFMGLSVLLCGFYIPTGKLFSTE